MGYFYSDVIVPADYAQRRWDMMVSNLQGVKSVEGDEVLLDAGYVTNITHYDAKPVDLSEKV